MSSIVDSLSEQEVVDLMAYAEGTLPEGRRTRVEAWVSGSDDLQELVRRQRLSLAATRGLAAEAVPASLVEAARAGRARAARPRRRRLTLALSAAGALAAVLVVFLVVSLGSPPVGPTVAAAAQVATLPATAAAPSPVPGTSHLDVAVQGLSFPDLAGKYGWRPVGVRNDTVAGRGATVVYYVNGGKQVAYAIVDSPVLASPDWATSTVRGGVEYLSLVAAGHPVVTWQRDGHTCVVVGDLAPEELLAFATASNGAAGTY